MVEIRITITSVVIVGAFFGIFGPSVNGKVFGGPFWLSGQIENASDAFSGAELDDGLGGHLHMAANADFKFEGAFGMGATRPHNPAARRWRGENCWALPRLGKIGAKRRK